MNNVVGHNEVGTPRSKAISFLTKLIGAAVISASALAVATPASAESKIVRIQQVSNDRYVDAHEHDGEDYRIVTRPFQDNDTQLWRMVSVGENVYTIQQLSSGRYWDAHEYEGEDYRLVTRPAQNNNTQRWLVRPVGNCQSTSCVYTIQQLSNGRYVDAHEYDGQDYRLVTRQPQLNATQEWRITTILTQIVDPIPVPPPGPTVYSSGTLQLPGPFTMDLDTGGTSLFQGDVLYAAPDLLNLQLIPQGGAQLSFTDGAQRGNGGFTGGCSLASYSSNPVPLSALSPGDYVCARTDEGRISEFRIDSIGAVLGVLTISYTTWE